MTPLRTHRLQFLRRAAAILIVVATVAASAPAAPAADTPLDALPSEKERWRRVSTDNFTFLTNTSARRAMKIGRKLEVLRDVLLATSSGLTDASPLPTTIYIFKDTKSFNRFNLGEDGEPEYVAGYFLRTDDANFVAIDASAISVPYPIIYHEYLHYFMENNVPGIPLWLNEGIAEFYSTFNVSAGKAQFGGAIPYHLQTISSGGLMSAASLFEVDTASPEYNEAERQGPFYAASWALAHYLLIDESRRGGTGMFLEQVSRGVAADKAVAAAYGIDMPTLQRGFLAHLNSGGISRTVTYDPPEAFEWHDGDAEPLTRGETLLALGTLLTNHPPARVDTVERYMAAAIEADASLRPRALAQLASANLLAERIDRAIEVAQQAVEAGSNDALTRSTYGFALLQMAVAALPDDVVALPAPSPELLAAREQFRAALEIDPEHVTSLVGLGLSHVVADGAVDEGLTALTRAAAARPARNDVLASQITLLARSGNAAGARALLERGLRPRGDTDEIALVEGTLANLEFERATALAAEGRFAEAHDVLLELADVTHDHEVRQAVIAALDEARRFAEMAAAAGSGPAPIPIVDPDGSQAAALELHSAAIDAANAGDYERAVELLDAFFATDAPEATKAMVRPQYERIAGIRKYNRHVDTMNAARVHLSEGRMAEARGLLEQVVNDDPAEDLGSMASQMLELMP